MKPRRSKVTIPSHKDADKQSTGKLYRVNHCVYVLDIDLLAQVHLKGKASF